MQPLIIRFKKVSVIDRKLKFEHNYSPLTMMDWKTYF